MSRLESLSRLGAKRLGARKVPILGNIETVTDVPSPVPTDAIGLPTRSATASRLASRFVLRFGSPIIRQARRLAGGNRQQILRRTPLLVAALVALISAPMFMRLTGRLVSARENNVWLEIQAEANNRMMRAQTSLAGGEEFQDGLMFLVKPKDKYSEPFGPTDLEPPLFKLADEASQGPAQSWYQQSGRSLQTFTRKISGDTFLVALADVTWLDGHNATQRSGVRRWAFLGWLLTVGISGLAAHLSLRPARRIMRERTDFLADAAHELRTPLAVIQASAGYALNREREPIEYVQSLVEIRSAAERASSGVTELLDLARFDAGQAVPRLAPLRLDLLAEEIVSATRIDGCELRTEVGPSVLVQGDMALLRQAVDNLVRNAAARSTTVVLRCRTEAGDGVLDVRDDGPGFSPEQLPYVFERYRRGDGRGSLGLGLPIAASIVAAHGGRIDIASPAPEPLNDQSPGSVVTIRLPRSRT
jgi:signal transduction histidine kinase